MNVSKFNEEIKGLITYMKDVGYSSPYVKQVVNMAAWIIKRSKDYKWKDYSDIAGTLAQLWTNKITLKNKILILRTIRRYVEEGAYPDGLKHYTKPSNYDFINNEFREVVDAACVAASKRRRDIRDIKYSLCSFFLSVQKQGASTLDAITESIVQKAFTENGILCRSRKFRSLVYSGLKECVSTYGQVVERVIAYLPAIPAMHRNIQYLTRQEYNAISNTLESDKSVSLEDKAIMTIAMYTGLRGSDIAGLTFDSIDWNRDLIRIRQSKTQNPLILPLRAVVGNAIFDYIKYERPRCQEPYIFITVNCPYRRYHTCNLDAICVKVMHKAGVRLSPDDRKGLHLFRHYVATSLLQSKVQQPVISATLGHASPRSLNHYLDADMERLKGCSLDISRFPIGKEVFGV